MIAPRPATLLDPLIERAAHEPQRLALVFIAEDGSKTRVTAGELHAEMLAAAHALQAIAIAPGDVLLLVMGHSRMLISTFLGALYAGVVPSIFSYPTDRMDARVYAERIRTVAMSAEARAVITTPQLATRISSLLADAGCPVLTTDAFPPAGGPVHPPRGARSPDQIAFLQYTSGTTGPQKGIAHTHARVLAFIAAKAEGRFRPDDVVVSWLPLYHDLGLVSGLLTPLVLGHPTVLMSPVHWVRDPRILLLAIHEFRGTLCWMPNFALNHCVRSIRERDLEGVDLSQWRELVIGGEPLRLASLQRFAERFGPYGFREKALGVGYGMAEAVEGATSTRGDGPPSVDWVRVRELQEEGRALPARPVEPGSRAVVACGAPHPGVELAIVDAEGKHLPDRRVGEIIVRSPYMMAGYHRRPDLTAQAIRDGWFYSGDLGYLAGGQLYVCGRKTDLIIVGGRNVYPEDLESIAHTVSGIHPGRAVAFGIEDERLGSERIVMVCEIHPDLDDDARRDVERELRRRATQELDVVLGDVRLVERGWLIKTSAGKMARTANRDKYRRELARPA